MSANTATKNGKQQRNHRQNKNESAEVKLSKLLSYLLRHGANKEGLTLGNDGSISLDDLCQHPNLSKTTFAEIQHVVDTNDKKRFVLFQPDIATNKWYIRASQGHSVELKEPPLTLLTASNMPETIVHGTMRANLPSVLETGLSKKQRTHIHFAKGLYGQNNVISGMRKNADTFIYINQAKCLQDNILFYESDNGVVLCKGLEDTGALPSKYFDKIVFK